MPDIPVNGIIYYEMSNEGRRIMSRETVHVMKSFILLNDVYCAQLFTYTSGNEEKKIHLACDGSAKRQYFAYKRGEFFGLKGHAGRQSKEMPNTPGSQ